MTARLQRLVRPFLLRRTKQEVLSELPDKEEHVLYFELEEDGWCCVRPSGTEPKIKFYFGVRGADMRAADEKLLRLKEGLLALAGNV